VRHVLEPHAALLPLVYVVTVLGVLWTGFSENHRRLESRIHARSQRYGNLRIQQELAQHGVQLEAEQQARLKDSELERARQIWQRKFGGAAPLDAAARAKQMRFLAGRGFSAEVIRRVLRADDE